jgi:hypothetical protein
MKCQLSILIYVSFSVRVRGNFLRNLVGSNCVLIETGKSARYYSCLGCIIENAINCVDLMRSNASGDVYSECDLSKLTLTQSSSCCPRFSYNEEGKKSNLLFVGSAYPAALRCIQEAGCQHSEIYSHLLHECESSCPASQFKDQFGEPVCFANFNSALKGGCSPKIFAIIFLLLLLLHLFITDF